MKFVWDLTEEKYNEMKDWMVDVNETEDFECFGCVRTGEICIDINAWCAFNDIPEYLEFAMFVGGVESPYGYSSLDEDYPYDHVDYFDGFPIKNVPYNDFKQIAETYLEKLIIKANETYDEADLVAEANKPLHIW